MASTVPKVSICLPNLNNRRFLPERLETIFQQTFTDWELVVVDNYSDDGAWEYFQERAAAEPRMRISQAPKAGMYANWNNCLRQARGEFIYIATSDDTMSPDCLSTMVSALEEHPECGIAHCCLEFIDDESHLIVSRRWEDWPSVKFFGNLIAQEHLRPVGHDTVVGLALKTPYYSITQVLIRRDTFAVAGEFATDWGSFADLEWQMRAALVAPTIHVPQKLATWRIHSNQGSQLDLFRKAIRDGWFVAMANSAIDFSRKKGLPRAGGLPRRLVRFFKLEQVQALWAELGTRRQKAGFLIRLMMTDPSTARSFVREWVRIRQADIVADIQQEMLRGGIQPVMPTSSADRSET